MKKKKQLPKELIEDSAKSLVVQQDMTDKANKVLGEVKRDLDQLGKVNDAQNEILDELLEMIESSNHETQKFDNSSDLTKLNVSNYEEIDTIKVSENESWEAFIGKTNDYALHHDINLEKDPFDNLLSKSEKIELTKMIQEDYQMSTPNCDKYDYTISSFSGVVTGMIDSFFVGMPNDTKNKIEHSKLENWTDKKVDQVVIKFANTVWHTDKKNGKRLRKEPKEIAQAIGYLERRHPVNYDARYAKDLKMGEQKLNMHASNHHLKSLGHSPDIVGLFFSLLDQFTGKASFISDGKILRLEPIDRKSNFELRGDTLIAKLFAGFSNWLGHLLSDVSGSSGTRGHMDGRRGSGIPIPFYSLLQMFDFGSIPAGDVNKTIAEFSSTVFESGYDARFGATMAIPVVLNELIIRLMWSVKSMFYHQNSLEDSMPVGNKPVLRRMLVVGHGVLCLVDGTDASLRSGGNMLLFAKRTNVIAWSRFAFSGLTEVRGLYKESGLDLVALEKDIEKEWIELFGEE